MKKVVFGIALFIIALPSLAVEWDFYGSVREAAWYWNQVRWYDDDFEEWRDSAYQDTNGNWIGDYVNVGYREDTLPRKRFLFDMHENSRFGARGKSERIGFGVEFGWVMSIKDFEILIEDQDARIDMRRREAIRLRRLFGEWYINEYFSLLVGQDYTPANFFPSNQAFLEDAGLYYAGNLYTGRHPMIKFSGDWEFGEAANLGFDAAWVKVDTSLFIVGGVGSSSPQPPVANEKFKAEGSFQGGFNAGDLFGFDAKVIGGYSGYELQVFRGQPIVGPFDVHCYIMGAEAGVKVWKFELDFNMTFAQNLNTYSSYLGNPWGWRNNPSMNIFYPKYGARDASDTVGAILNNKINMFCGVAKVHPFEWLTAEGGFGKVTIDHEDSVLVAEVEQASNGLRRLGIYGNLQFKLVDQHLILVPEFSYSDFGGYEGEGKWYAGGFKIQLDL